MSRPRLLDLFCCAGGAAMGYHRAGFEVVGVDITQQPHYPFEFREADALMYLRARGREFDAIHASPPCHDHSTVTGRNRKASGAKGTGWLLEATLELLDGIDLPFVVENVETAKFPDRFQKIKLCGSSFGLDVRRHRWFANNVGLTPKACDHSWQTPRFRSLDSRRPPGAMATVVGVHGHLNYPGELDLRRKAMGIDWMTNGELTQAIPPAYTEYIGRQLLAHINSITEQQEAA